MFESLFSTSTDESSAFGPAGILLDGAVRRHVVAGQTVYQNALSDKRVSKTTARTSQSTVVHRETLGKQNVTTESQVGPRNQFSVNEEAQITDG